MKSAQLDTGIRDSFKIRQLADELGCSRLEATGVYVNLLAWVAKERELGFLEDVTGDQIAFECRWEGDGSQLIEALRRVGVLVGERNELSGFFERHGGYLVTTEANRVRNRARRDGVKLSAGEAGRIAEANIEKMRSVSNTDAHVSDTDEVASDTDGHNLIQSNLIQSNSIQSKNDGGSAPPPPGAKEVLDYYLEKFPLRERQAKSDKSRRAVKARLAEGYTPAELKRAIDGNLASEFHQDGGHNSIGLIFRNAEKVDYFMGKASPPRSNLPAHQLLEPDPVPEPLPPDVNLKKMLDEEIARQRAERAKNAPGN